MQRSCVRIAPSRHRMEDWPSWLMAPVLKTGRLERVSWVRILHLPQIGAWCSGSTAVSKTVNESSTLSAPATLGWRSGERIGPQNRHSRVRIPLRAQKKVVYLHPQNRYWIWHRHLSSQHVGVVHRTSLAVPYPEIAIVITSDLVISVHIAAKSRR